jgi:hypothetical protein
MRRRNRPFGIAGPTGTLAIVALRRAVAIRRDDCDRYQLDQELRDDQAGDLYENAGWRRSGIEIARPDLLDDRQVGAVEFSMLLIICARTSPGPTTFDSASQATCPVT